MYECWQNVIRNVPDGFCVVELRQLDFFCAQSIVMSEKLVPPDDWNVLADVILIPRFITWSGSWSA